MSYFFHFSSCIVGPSINFSDFRNFIYLREEYKDIPKSKVFKNTLLKMFYWIVFTVNFLIASKYFYNEYLYSEEFGNRNIVFKLIYIYFAANTLRVKYFSGWQLSITAMTFSGITYSKHIDSKTNEVVEKFDKGENFDWWGVELEPNPKKKMTVSYYNNFILFCLQEMEYYYSPLAKILCVLKIKE